MPVDEGQPTQAATTDWTPPSWDEWVRDPPAVLYRLAYRVTGNTHDAEDLTQEVFVRVFRSLSSYTPGTFEGWLHRITTNLFLDMTRRRQRIRFEGLGEETTARLRGSEPSPAPACGAAGRRSRQGCAVPSRRRPRRSTTAIWTPTSRTRWPIWCLSTAPR